MRLVHKAFVYLEQSGKALMVQEKGRAWGLWGFPGGHVEEGETFEEAAIREAKEEVGYDVRIVRKLGSKRVSGSSYKGAPSDNNNRVEVHIFEGEIVGGNLDDGVEDFLDVRWVSMSEIADLPLRWEWLKELMP